VLVFKGMMIAVAVGGSATGLCRTLDRSVRQPASRELPSTDKVDLIVRALQWADGVYLT
jgi:hypothetical protein